MNIAIFISSLQIGGAEKQAVLDANLLSAQHKVFLITFQNGPLDKLINKDVTLIVLDKLKYIKTASNLKVILNEKKIDVIHASLFGPMIVSCMAARQTNVSLIWHFHSHEYDAPLRSKIAFRYFSHFSNVKKILFVNNELKLHFSYMKFPKNKLGILYNHSEVINSEKKQDNSPQINIGYVGRIIKLKRVEYLIELAGFLQKNNCPSFKIHLVGDGDALGSIKQLIEEKKLNDLFVIHGFQTDVQKHYRNFDVFVNPSSEECLSIAMIDAGMMALPIVAFNVGGNNEIVINEESGFIVNSKEEFFKKIYSLIRDKELLLKMSIASKEYCQAKFSKDNHLKELEKLYLELK